MKRNWAKRVKLDGCPNLHRVAAGIYRGAQPTADGLDNLWGFGIRSVINLRSWHRDLSMIHPGTQYFQIRTRAWDVDERDIRNFLRIIQAPGTLPVFFHCQHGADRTGIMCAAYRVFAQGWTADEALDEMIHGGFGFHRVWINLVWQIRLWGLKRRFRRAVGKLK